MGKWLRYNSAAESFHTKKLCSKLYSTDIEFYLKQKWLFEPPFGGLRGNVRTPSIARGRLPIFHNELFCISYG